MTADFPVDRPIPDASDLRLLGELINNVSIPLVFAAHNAQMSQQEAAWRLVTMAEYGLPLRLVADGDRQALWHIAQQGPAGQATPAPTPAVAAAPVGAGAATDTPPPPTTAAPAAPAVEVPAAPTFPDAPQLPPLAATAAAASAAPPPAQPANERDMPAAPPIPPAPDMPTAPEIPEIPEAPEAADVAKTPAVAVGPEALAALQTPEPSEPAPTPEMPEPSPVLEAPEAPTAAEMLADPAAIAATAPHDSDIVASAIPTPEDAPEASVGTPADPAPDSSAQPVAQDSEPVAAPAVAVGPEALTALQTPEPSEPTPTEAPAAAAPEPSALPAAKQPEPPAPGGGLDLPEQIVNGPAGETLHISILEIVDNANEQLTAAGFTPPADHRAVLVHSKVANSSGVDYPLSGDLNLVLEDIQQQLLGRVGITLASHPPFPVGVGAGQTAAGWSVFFVPTATVVAGLKWCIRPDITSSIVSWTL